jgi:hypothetical protein
MALRKNLILRRPRSGRLEGRRAPIHPSDTKARRYIDALIAVLAALAICVAAWGARAQSPGNFSTLSTTGTATLNGDVLMCSGRPWLDVRCPSMSGGAVGDGSHDDTSAIQTAINTAVTNNWPVNIPAGTYKVTSRITIDYAGQAGNGFRLISHGATLDGRTIASGAVLQIQCSGGTPASPANCFYFRQEGTLFVTANTPGYAVRVGLVDFSDAHNSLKLDHLVVNNASTASGAGGLQLNYVLDSDIFAVADAAGGAAGIAPRADAVLAHLRRRLGLGHRRHRAPARTGLQFRQHGLRLRHGGLTHLPRHHLQP